MKTSLGNGVALIVWLAAASSLWAAGVEVVHPEFLNELKVGAANPPATQSSSMEFHGGNIGPCSELANPGRESALSFDGVDDYVSAPPIDLANQSFSLEAWARRRAADGYDFMIGQGGGGTDRSLYFGYHAAGNQFVFGFYGDDLWAGNSYTDNGWHHWAGTYDASNKAQCLYRDGILIVSNTASANYQGTGPIIIGSLPWAGGCQFDGLIDDVRIWHVALSATQIQTNMNRRLTDTEPGLVAYWPFDEGQGTTTADVTGQGYTATLYNGTGWWSPRPTTIPTDGTWQLVESSFGQAFATDIPYPDFVHDSMLSAQAMLYPPLDMSPVAVPNSTNVFRYKVILFSTNSGGVAPDPSKMSSCFGDAERQNFGVAVKYMRDALKYAPYNRDLRHTLLDAYYDLAVAEAQFAKVDQAQIALYRLGLQVPPNNGFVIDGEIQVSTNLLKCYETALSRYGQLLTDTMGVDVSQSDPAVTNGMPLGAYIFQQEQPFRSQYAAQFYDSDGVLKTVPQYNPFGGLTTNGGPPRVLFAGYKDYVNLVGLLREYATSSADLARLYGMRGLPDDIQAAYKLIGKVQSEAQIEVLVLRGLFPDYAPTPGDASGFWSTLNGLGVGLADLDNVRAFLDGKGNLLGFDPNFLVLIQQAQGTNGMLYDTYDALMSWIYNGPYAPLTVAQNAFNTAVAGYGTYKGNADQVSEQLSSIANTYSERYYKITGWDPGDASTNHVLAPKSGSELWQASQNITLANTRVQTIGQEASQLKTIISQANQVVNLAIGKTGRLLDAKNQYLDDTSSAWDDLTTWAGAMALSQATYDTINDSAALLTAAAGSEDPLGVVVGGGGAMTVAVAGAANMVVQTMGATKTAQANQTIDEASASFDVAKLNASVPTEIAQAQVEFQDKCRQQTALALEMDDARATQAQEVARRSALINELQRIKQQGQESDASLADRYYADPVHYLRAQNDLILADAAFKEAQRWVFFALRALEFKWNKDFVISLTGKDWELSSLFKLRNYKELHDLVAAMNQFNEINLIGFNREHDMDRISLRDDIMAPPAGGTNGLWLDVVTGERVSSINLFRRKLQRSLVFDGPNVYLDIPLNTVALKKATGSFFVGPHWRTDGSVRDAGKYLDKIDYLKFNVVGSNPAGTYQGHLRYGGTCYIRTRMPPCINPAEPFTLPGEYREFPFFYFRTLNNGATWETLKTQEDNVKVAFSAASGEPAGDTLANTSFRERSVAATDWVFTLFVSEDNSEIIDISKIDDIEIWISHFSVSGEIPTCP